MIEMKEDGQKKYAKQARDCPGKDGQKNGPAVLPEQMDLLVQRNGKADRRRCEQVVQIDAARLVRVIINAEQKEDADDKNDGNEQRVYDCQSRLPFQILSGLIADQAHEDAEKKGMSEKIFCH